ncbi:MAG TPA: MBL fold metallo-hydrolase [Nitrospirales bacterium]|jgi:7,8-dihydropterin-6-yl-methyl-4-(beta-D-ribofuranosyl)aminobenzene 5'-phosphate synthase|nr:MBL fold metallo-hydrolase [Nitrospirales bacterium]
MKQDKIIPLTRRDVLQTGIRLAGAALVGVPMLQGRPRTVWAKSSAPPVVDRLAVRIIIDSFHDILTRSKHVGNIKVERTGTIRGPQGNRMLQSQWGFATHLESQRNDETRQVLLDFGGTGEVLFHNYDLLKIDLAHVDALIVSHGHDDHFEGMVPMLQRYRATMRKNLQVYIGGEDTLCYRWIRPGQEDAISYALDRKAIEAAGVKIVLAQKPTVVAGHAFTTGEIPRGSFEKILPTPHIEVGMRHGLGCHSTLFSHGSEEGKTIADDFPGEHATCYHVKGRGLVVISSCGHKGIVNSVRQAQAASGVEKVHAVMGGFHLAPASDAYIAQTVQELKKINPDHVMPMHCSGPGFINAMQNEFPDKLVLSYTGSRFIFGG